MQNAFGWRVRKSPLLWSMWTRQIWQFGNIAYSFSHFEIVAGLLLTFPVGEEGGGEVINSGALS